MEKTIVERLIETRIQISNLKRQEEFLKEQILQTNHQAIQLELKDKDYGSGTATIVNGNHQIKVTFSKNVKWDQEQLRQLHDQIAAGGEDPTEYLKVKFDIAETAYKSWPSNIRNAFEPARTVELSTPKIEIEEIK